MKVKFEGAIYDCPPWTVALARERAGHVSAYNTIPRFEGEQGYWTQVRENGELEPNAKEQFVLPLEESWTETLLIIGADHE